jgi:hypothetical protein
MGSAKKVGMIIDGRLTFHLQGVHHDTIKGKNNEDFKTISTGIETYNNLQNRGLVATDKKVYFGNIPINMSQVGKDLLVDNSKGMTVV